MLNFKKNNKKKIPPKLGMVAYFGEAPRSRAELIQDIVNKYGPIVKLPWNMAGYTIFNDPQSIQHILLDNSANFERLDPFYFRLKQLLGNGLLTNVDASWLAQRQLLQPFFHPSNLMPFIQQTAEITKNHLKTWQPLAQKQKKFDIAHDLSTLTVILAGKILFNIDLTQQASDFVKWIRICNRQISYSLFTYPKWFPTYSNWRFQYTLKQIYQFVQKILQQRTADNAPIHDLLTLILQSKDPQTQRTRSIEFMLEEVLTFLVTAYESLGSCLSWTWYLLSQNPDIKTNFLTEINKLDTKSISTQDELSQLSYTKLMVQESMRLYPPIWGIARRSVHDDEINGYFVPAGSPVIFSTYVIHRNEKYWPEPNRFLPERFLPEQSRQRPKYTYLPFGGGPRICIGSSLAIMQAQVILATIAQHYDITILPQKIILECLVTLKSQNGIYATVQERT